MANRIVRTGMDLEMEVMRKCARELKLLPQAARMRVADWLQQSALDIEANTPGSDPRHPELFERG